MKRKILSILLTLAVVSSLGLVSALPVVANGEGEEDGGQTLNVAEWSEVATLENVSGRQATIKVDDTYHMWYATSKAVVNYTSSKDPESFTAGTTCTFTNNGESYIPLAGVDSVTVLEEGGTFYMITYGADEKTFAIYTSTGGNKGTVWKFEGVVFDGSDTFFKIDAPCLMKDNDTYRLYFQAKVNDGDEYKIYVAEANATALSTSINFELGDNSEAVLEGKDAWENAGVLHPMVVKDGDIYYMWYRGQKTGPSADPQLGFASSADGITWVKSPGNPVLPRTEDIYADAEPSVIKDGDTWHIWYQSTQSGAIKHISANGPFEFSSIQAAIDAPSDSDTTIIQVAAGTYTAGFTISEKTNITITGDSAESTIIEPSELVNTEVDHKSTTNMQAVVFVNASMGITIENITFKSTSATPGSGGADAIVFWNNSSGEVSDCVVQGIYGVISGAQTGQGIAVDAGVDGATELALTNVSINGTQKNAIDIVDGNGSTSDNNGTINVTVNGGTITGAGSTSEIAQNGIVLWNRGGGVITVIVEDVTLSGFKYTGNDEACAILNYGTTNSNLTVTDSTFTENQVQVFNRNVSGDLSSAFEENTFDLAVLGKKTESGSLANVIFGSIQAAVTEAKNGDTIRVAAGTYDEGEITVAKELAIIGVADSGGEKPVIKGTLNFTDSADGSSLKNLKFVANIGTDGTDNKRDDNITLNKIDGFSIVDCEFYGNVNLTGDEPDEFTQANRAVQIPSSGSSKNITIDNCNFYGGYYVAIQGYADNLTVKNCDIKNVKSGINLQVGSNLIVENTDISVIPQGAGNDTYCVRFASSSGTSNNMTINGGTFKVADSDFTPTENVYHSAIVIRASAGGTLKANYLNLYGSVVNLSEVELDATNNWWGNASGPVKTNQGYTAYGNEIVGTGNVVYNPWLLEPVEENVEIKTYDKTLALKDGWTLISFDKNVTSDTAWKGTTAISENNDILAYSYTGDGYAEVLYPEYMSIIDAYYVKTNGGGGVGLKYSTGAPPAMVNKTLTAGWNLISCADKSDAYTLLTQLRFTGTGTAAITNLVSPGSYNQFTGSKSVALGVEDDWDAIKVGEDKITLNPFDGYWVYMNAAKSYGVIPD